MTPTGYSALRLSENDNVAIALKQLHKGAPLGIGDLLANGFIAPGHKVALCDVYAGQMILRYGQVIGVARELIRTGDHVHTHNVDMYELSLDYRLGAEAKTTSYFSPPASFKGIVREDGRIATRNYIGVIASVNCSATVVSAITDYFRRDFRPEALADYPQIDGVVPITHPLGCGVDMQSDAMAMLRRTLAGYVVHPNFHSVLVIGLGCEALQIGDILQAGNVAESARVKTMFIQESGGTRKTIQTGIESVKAMLDTANAVQRVDVPVSNLSVGLQCGGSDSYSGITANPALGAAVDLLVRHGGTAILSETPEIYGAEHLLARRAVSTEVGQKLVDRIEWWKAYCEKNGAELNNNPSVGNKQGGLTTILEKSLGGVTKGGTTNLVDVYEYAEKVTKRGLVFMDSPGYDPISATGQIAGGANIICFTTGRGSAFGCVPSPSIKLASNTALWKRQEDDMDINCGRVIDEHLSIEEMGADIFQKIVSVASGEQSKSERYGYGRLEFMPWLTGIIT